MIGRFRKGLLHIYIYIYAIIYRFLNSPVGMNMGVRLLITRVAGGGATGQSVNVRMHRAAVNEYIIKITIEFPFVPLCCHNTYTTSSI